MLHLGQIVRQVADEALLVARVPAQNLPQLSGLGKVVWSQAGRKGAHLAHPLLVLRDGGDGRRARRRLVSGRLEQRVDVVGVVAIVARKVHEAVALEGAVDGRDGVVGGQHLVVGAQTVAGRVGVGEHARLQHWRTESLR